MGAKGSKTKQYICQEAYRLFAENGYKTVTMKDICERTGLSRGGLYRHYNSTEQIFLEITKGFTEQKNVFLEKMEQHVSAVEILNAMLVKYEAEMLDSQNSLSLAIYEFYSNPAISKTDNSMMKQYEYSKQLWIELVRYGIERGEFKEISPEAIFDMLIFSYQGVRMYSKLMEIDVETPKRIMNEIRKLMLA